MSRRFEFDLKRNDDTPKPPRTTHISDITNKPDSFKKPASVEERRDKSKFFSVPGDGSTQKKPFSFFNKKEGSSDSNESPLTQREFKSPFVPRDSFVSNSPPPDFRFQEPAKPNLLKKRNSVTESNAGGDDPFESSLNQFQGMIDSIKAQAAQKTLKLEQSLKEESIKSEKLKERSKELVLNLDRQSKEVNAKDCIIKQLESKAEIAEHDKLEVFQQNSDLKVEVQNLTVSTTTLNTENERLVFEKTNLEARLEESTCLVDLVKKDLAGVKDEAKSFQDRFTSSNNELVSLLKQQKQQAEILMSCQEEVLNGQQMIAHLKAQLLDIEVTCANLKEELAQTLESKLSIEERCNDLVLKNVLEREQSERLQKAFHEANEVIKKLKAEFQTVENERTDWIQKLAEFKAIQTEKEELEQTLATLYLENEEYQCKWNDTNQRLAELESSLAEKTRELEEQNQKNDNMVQENEKHLKELDVMKSTLDQAIKDKEALLQLNNHFEEQTQTRLKDIVQTININAVIPIAKSQDDSAEMKELMEQHEQEIKKLKNQSKGIIEKKTMEIQNAMHQIKQLKEKCEEKDRDIKKFQDTIKALDLKLQLANSNPAGNSEDYFNGTKEFSSKPLEAKKRVVSGNASNRPVKKRTSTTRTIKQNVPLAKSTSIDEFDLFPE